MPGQLHNLLGRTEVSLFESKANAAVVQPPLTGNTAYVRQWNSESGAMSQFDLELWAPATCNLTLAELYGGATQALAIVDDDVDTVDFANNELDITSHIYQMGDGPLTLSTSDTLPTGLSLTQQYWVIYTNSGTIQLALTLQDALAGTAVAFSDVGVGTHTISDVVTAGDLTQRVYWFSYGLLGQAADGAIGLTATKGYTQRLGHRPRTVAYAVSATLSASVLNASVYPIIEE